MDPNEFNKMMKRLRNGETVTCPLCEKGVLESKGDYRVTHCFECTECKKKLNIN